MPGPWGMTADTCLAYGLAEPVPGITGGGTAAPILFKAVEAAGLDRVAFPVAPAGAVRIAAGELPAALQRFDNGADMTGASRHGSGNPLHIVFPADGSNVEIDGHSSGDAMPLAIKLQGGHPPFRLLVNGRPVDGSFRRRQLYWIPDSAGIADITVLDAAGHADSVEFKLQHTGS